MDSTCLIGLERIGRLDILPALFESIVIPPEVEREFGSSLPWLLTEKPINHELVAALRLVVDVGEAEAIALAKEKNCRLIADDKQARIAAQSMGLRIIGTIGILVLAKQQGVVGSLRSVLNDLEKNQFYVSKSLREEALRLVDE